jgi:hypothetical protein
MQGSCCIASNGAGVQDADLVLGWTGPENLGRRINKQRFLAGRRAGHDWAHSSNREPALARILELIAVSGIMEDHDFVSREIARENSNDPINVRCPAATTNHDHVPSVVTFCTGIRHKLRSESRRFELDFSALSPGSTTMGAARQSNARGGASG